MASRTLDLISKTNGHAASPRERGCWDAQRKYRAVGFDVVDRLSVRNTSVGCATCKREQGPTPDTVTEVGSFEGLSRGCTLFAGCWEWGQARHPSCVPVLIVRQTIAPQSFSRTQFGTKLLVVVMYILVRARAESLVSWRALGSDLRCAETRVSAVKGVVCRDYAGWVRRAW